MKILGPYKYEKAGQLQYHIRYGLNYYEQRIHYVFSIDNLKWYARINNELVINNMECSVDDAKNLLDEKLIKLGYILCSKEKVDKLLLLK